MLIWRYLAASPVKSEAKVWMKNWLGNWSWGVRIKTWLVFNIKNSILVCSFLNSLLTLSYCRLADPERRHDLQLYPLKSHSIYQNMKETFLMDFCFRLLLMPFPLISYDVVCHQAIVLTKQCSALRLKWWPWRAK